MRRSYVVVEVGQTASAYLHCVRRHDRSHPLHVALTARICVFCEQHYPDRPCNGDVPCSL